MTYKIQLRINKKWETLETITNKSEADARDYYRAHFYNASAGLWRIIDEKGNVILRELTH